MSPRLVNQGLRLVRQVGVDLGGDAAGHDLQDLRAQVDRQDVGDARQWPAKPMPVQQGFDNSCKRVVDP